jgi:hypothetical protein
MNYRYSAKFFPNQKLENNDARADQENSVLAFFSQRFRSRSEIGVTYVYTLCDSNFDIIDSGKHTVFFNLWQRLWKGTQVNARYQFNLVLLSKNGEEVSDNEAERTNFFNQISLRLRQKIFSWLSMYFSYSYIAQGPSSDVSSYRKNFLFLGFRVVPYHLRF